MTANEKTEWEKRKEMWYKCFSKINKIKNMKGKRNELE